MVVPDSSSLGIIARAELSGYPNDPPVPVVDYDYEVVGQVDTLEDLNVTVEANVLQDGSSVSTKASGTATWSSASEGTIFFDDVGWDIDATGYRTGVYGTDDLTGAGVPTASGHAWEYTFTLDSPAEFKIDFSYDITGTNNGLFEPKLRVTGPDVGFYIDQPLSGSNSTNVLVEDGEFGNATVELGSAGQYTVDIYIYDDLSSSMGFADVTSFFDATFNWDIV